MRVRKSGQKCFAKGLGVEAAEGEAGTIRYGLTVSKRAHKSAVCRNRIKRRLRALVCDVLPDQAIEGMDYVLIGRAQSQTRSYDSLQKDLLWCLGKLDCGKDSDVKS